MGRPPSSIWMHFDKVSKAEGSQYWEVVCRHCRVVHGNAADVINGRVRNMQQHLLRCDLYKDYAERHPGNDVVPPPPPHSSAAMTTMTAMAHSVSTEAARTPSNMTQLQPANTKPSVGRPLHPVWQHYERLGRRQGSQYYYVACKLCGYGNPTGEVFFRPLEGRVRDMCAHLDICERYAALPEEERGAYHVHVQKELKRKESSSTGHTLQQMRKSGQNGEMASIGEAPIQSQGLKRARLDVLNIQRMLHQLRPETIKTHDDQRASNDVMASGEVAKFHDAVVDMLSSTRLPAWWVEHPTTVRMFESVRPAAATALPSRDVVSDLTAERRAREKELALNA